MHLPQVLVARLLPLPGMCRPQALHLLHLGRCQTTRLVLLQLDQPLLSLSPGQSLHRFTLVWPLAHDGIVTTIVTQV